MKKIETTLESVVSDLTAFYDYKVWEFLTLNGVAIDEGTTEIQWIFSRYGAIDDVVIYYAPVKNSETVPSVVDLIPSAIISQREIVDMFGITVENSEKGLYLDEDSLSAPLATCRI